MPNHVRNVWRVKNIPPEKIRYILDRCSALVPGSEDRIIDFDLIIPEPRFKKDCPKEYLVNKDSHVQEYEGREWFDWYEWHLAHWGTKWNAYDGYTEIQGNDVQFVFNTAWSLAQPVVIALTKLGYDLEIMWADEDYGSNCGVRIYNAEDEEWVLGDTDVEGEDPSDFAQRIWDEY